MTEKTGDVDVVPGLLVVAARTVVVNVDEVILDLVSKDVVDDATFGGQFRVQTAWIFQCLTIAIAEDVGRKPTVHMEIPIAKSRRIASCERVML